MTHDGLHFGVIILIFLTHFLCIFDTVEHESHHVSLHLPLDVPVLVSMSAHLDELLRLCTLGIHQQLCAMERCILTHLNVSWVCVLSAMLSVIHRFERRFLQSPAILFFHHGQRLEGKPKRAACANWTVSLSVSGSSKVSTATNIKLTFNFRGCKNLTASHPHPSDSD